MKINFGVKMATFFFTQIDPQVDGSRMLFDHLCLSWVHYFVANDCLASQSTCWTHSAQLSDIDTVSSNETVIGALRAANVK